MKTTSARSLRIAVGTVLLGLGGCTPSTTTTTDGAKKTPEKAETKEIEHTVNEGPVETPPKTPDPEPTPKTTAADDGGCQPPDCHINPGPNDVPKPKPEPEPPPPPDIKVNPGPEPTVDQKPVAEPEPKHVNTGPVKPPREH